MSADPRVEAAQKALEGVSVGPWVWDGDQLWPEGKIAKARSADPYLADENEWPKSMVGVRAIITTDGGHYGPNEPDAEFIAAAPKLVADLLAVIAERDAVIARVRAAQAQQKRFSNDSAAANRHDIASAHESASHAIADALGDAE